MALLLPRPVQALFRHFYFARGPFYGAFRAILVLVPVHIREKTAGDLIVLGEIKSEKPGVLCVPLKGVLKRILGG